MKGLSIFACLCALLCSSCSTLALASAGGRSWSNGDAERSSGVLALAKPSVERQTDAASIEDDIERLMPLLFLEHGRRLQARGLPADCLVDVRAVERDYQEGWRGGRSVSVELWIRRSDGSAAFALRTAPLVASRMEASGEVSLASARDLRSLLSRAVSLACRELDAREQAR